MVNPLVSAATTAAPNPPALEMESPALESARTVTASAQSANTGAAADKHQGGTSQPAKPMEQVLEELNGSLKAWSTGMRFDFDDDAQRVVVSIIDSATGETLRTVPSDAVIRVAKMIVQLQGNGIRTQA